LKGSDLDVFEICLQILSQIVSYHRGYWPSDTESDSELPQGLLAFRYWVR